MDKTFDHEAAEARIYAAWEEAGAFRAGAGAKSGAETFSIVIPPPNVTGSLHMGHAFNNTLQDILVRWHRMRGHDTLWQPGTDHAGIATQMVTEREMAANGEPPRREMGREAFVERVWQQKQKSRGTIIGQLRRLGASCDWSREAFTMGGAPGDPDAGSGPDFHDAVIRVFVELYEQGKIYRGKRLVNWDPHFETAISDLEVENVETPGHMWHFRYPLAGGETYEYIEKDEDGTVTLRETRDYISIATTRPETMLGDGAVAVHPSDERYAPIVGKLCEIPVGPKEHRRLIPIITDEYPDPDFGSGAVKITGAHDFNDYEVAKRGGIPMYRLMDTKAQMRADGAPHAEAAAVAMSVAKGERTLNEAEADAVNLVPDDLRGLDRLEARQRVVDQITAEGLAVMVPPTDPRLGAKAAKAPEAPEEGGEARADTLVPLVETKPIMQPFGDRSKVVIEPMLTDQWFVDAAQIVGPALDAVRDGTVKILPERDAKVYFHWLENIEPWCISRQLWWGHRIPVWFDADGNQYCATTEAEAQKKAGDGVALTQDPDVLDTWFSSGLWPIGTLGWPEETEELKRYFPTSVLVTGFDIIFFWVARMMMMQYAIVEERPFDTVYVHALVRDEKGKKMSKSLGNVLDPLDLIDEFGADAVRFTLSAMAAMGRDLKLSKDRIAGYRNFSTKLWNACRFAEMNGAFEAGAPEGIPEATAPVNRWILGETAKAAAETSEALEAFRFNDAANTLYSFVWGTVCDWYVEFSKPLLMGEDAAMVAETRAVMAWVIDRCLALLHPFMPYVTEELWGTLASRATPLILAPWPELDVGALADEEASQEMAFAISLIDGIRSARAQVRVPAGLQVPMVHTGMDARAEAAWAANEAMIMRLARIASLEAAGEMPKGAITVPVKGATFGLPLADIIDAGAEKARLEKTLKKLQGEIGGMRKRLENPKFIESAPDDVIEETRGNLEARQAEENKLADALARISEIA
ncbi:valine--tRNA ligase [Tropicimonas sp. IMCC34011]|uniref:valine--tRNA ligase n=1 Tax=Tropicimonas sp. IMCC34011 TaxID=2248759 RepID=UPI001E459337|nr:valine--tRNA ligase [Tropicimonas sp. IMCC34011]